MGIVHVLVERGRRRAPRRPREANCPGHCTAAGSGTAAPVHGSPTSDPRARRLGMECGAGSLHRSVTARQYRPPLRSRVGRGRGPGVCRARRACRGPSDLRAILGPIGIPPPSPSWSRAAPASSPATASSSSCTRGGPCAPRCAPESSARRAGRILVRAGAQNVDLLEFVTADLARDDGVSASPGERRGLHVASPVAPGRVEN
ncbi:hypothetical protein QJS66_11225 [Kocuria rhizophila]|nr:hypothetical protein QJS66_11225 [Kocuria rhizophila]